MPVRISISYSHNNAEYRRKLTTQVDELRRYGAVDNFDDGDVDPGADLDVVSKDEVRDADVSAALASADYLAGAYRFKREYLIRTRPDSFEVYAHR